MKPPVIIPPAALEQHTAVLGKSGSGKTYTTKAVIVEPLLEAGKHFAGIDPTSAWWGLRSSRDGKGPGFPVLVLGGDHGDLPLPANGGEAVARLIVEQRMNVICDTGNLTVGERTRWMTAFAGTLYRLNRAPLYLAIDEAHVFAPQGKVPDPDTGKMLHAVNQLAAGGRSRGIRLTLITQRPQKLHKDTLTTADTLIALRVLAPHDRAAVKDWIDGCGDPAQGKQVLDSLAQLQRGEGWVWYPEGGHLVRAKFPPIKTFDSSATPTDGHALPAPKGAAEVDLTEVRAALSEAVKEAEANDPKLLRAAIAKKDARIAELERGAGKVQADPNAVVAAEKRGYLAGRGEGREEVLSRILSNKTALRDALATLHKAVEVVDVYDLPPIRPVESVPAQRFGEVHVEQVAQQRVPDGASMKAMPRAFLTALAQAKGGLLKRQIRVRTGYRDSGPVSACFAELARNGWTEPGDAGLLTITPQGLAALGAFDPLPTGRALQDHLLSGDKLPTMQKNMLRQIIGAYPNSIGKGRIRELCGYADSGPVSSAFAHLVALDYVIADGRGALRASQDLFDV